MELVSGRTLTDCIQGKPLPLPEALRYAVQVAEALTAAHAAGIIHRDLKPGNIMVNGSGGVKVLDFGLAKLTERFEDNASAHTVTLAEVNTSPGEILGTASYMSPEQADGRSTDARSDIFSFGAVLYEMLSGQRTFTGKSQLSILSAVLNEEPKPLADLTTGLPMELDRAVSRCLRKDPNRRFQTMADLKAVLEESREESDSGKLVAGRKNRIAGRRHKWFWPSIAAGLLLAAAGTGMWIRTLPEAPPSRLIPLTSFPGIESGPSLSPDGTRAAFAWNGEKEDNFDVYVKQIDGDGFTRLTTDPAPEGIPNWSPDGRTIAFISVGKPTAIMLIPAIGGPARKLLESVALGQDVSRALYGWPPDSKSLVVNHIDGVSNAIALFSIDSGQVRQLTFPPKSTPGDGPAALSPDGRTVAFFRSIGPMRSNIYTVPITGGEPRQITSGLDRGGGLCWSSNGKEIVFSSDVGSGRRLWRVPANASPDRVPALVEFAGEDAQDPYIAGSRLIYTRRHERHNLWRTALDGKQAEPTRMLASSRSDHHPAYSPDGKKIAFQSDRTGVAGLWVATSEGDNPVRLTNLYVTVGPVWSPDSKSLAFGARDTGQAELYVSSTDGGTPRRVGKSLMPQSWSRDGKWIYGLMIGGNLQTFKIRAEGGEPVQVTHNGAFHAQESADGRYVLYTKVPNMGGVLPSSFWRLPVDGGEEVKLHDGIYSERWQPAGNGIYFVDFQQVRTREKTIYFLDILTREVKRVAVVTKSASPLPGFTISPDGRWIITTHGEPPIADIMLVDNFR
jgi:Tol biopolymer transport system component